MIKTERNYSFLYEFILIFFGIVVFSIGYAVKTYCDDLPLLYNSLKTPWGIITAAFVYDGAGNIESYAVYASVFMASNAAYVRSMRVPRYFVVTAFSLISAILGNLINLGLYVVKYPNGFDYGQSGIVYGFIGSMAIFIFFDFTFYLLMTIRKAIKKSSGIKKISTVKSKFRKILTYFFTTISFGLTFVYLIIDRSSFFSIGPGVDAFVHAISFAIGVILSLIMILRYKERVLWIS